MADTATLNIYRLKDSVTLEEFNIHIETTKGYTNLALKGLPVSDYEIVAYHKINENIPDFFKFVAPVIAEPSIFYFCKYNFLIIFKGDENTFVVTSGSAFHLIDSFAEVNFGIQVLERVFNEDINKLDSIKEKGIIGDILASSRFYRNARALAYEDDFGKYFQNINIKLTKTQVLELFPSINKDRCITISGSSYVSIKSKVNFEGFIKLLHDLGKVLKIPANPTFNQSLIPLDKRKEKMRIKTLNEQVFLSLREDTKAISKKYDFCHRNFEEFFSSTSCHFSFDSSLIEKDDIHSLSNFEFINEINEEIDRSLSDEDYVKVISTVEVQTIDDDDQIITKGSLIDYLQTELQYDGQSYFLLDGLWYQIENKFDENLSGKYKARIVDKIKVLSILKSWKSEDDETAYNIQHKDLGDTYYLHCVLVDHIELCDILHYDELNKKVYIVHVKKGLTNSMRDLVSQVVISAKIIEDEKRMTEDKMIKLSSLYDKAVSDSHNRINPESLSKSDFLNLFKNNKVEYCLAILDTSKRRGRLESGEFGSRIAKFSLVELASIMNANSWLFSIHDIEKG